MRIMKIVPAAALAAFLLAPAWAPPPAPGTGPVIKERRVLIAVETVDKRAGLVFTPHKLVTRKKDGETIVWACPGYKIFTLDFGWASPFPEVSYQTQDGAFALPILPDSPEGHFSYFVAVLDEKNRRIITSDPDLIIRR